jgi:hypothetical protein
VAYSYVLDPGKIFSAWKSEDVAARFAALGQETDYAALVKGLSTLEMWAVGRGYIIPLLQGTTTVVHRRQLRYAPFANGAYRPYYWKLS